jgi:hypothetical protein
MLHTTKENETIEPKATKMIQSLRSSLLINVCPFSYKGTTIYRRPSGVIKQPNNIFSVPDKQLYTLLEGITVTPHFVGRPACLRTVDPPLHATPFVSPSYRDLHTSSALTCSGAPLIEPGPPHAPRLRRRNGPPRHCVHERPLRHFTRPAPVRRQSAF